jgi:hypothetical protein
MLTSYSYTVLLVQLIERRIQINDFGESHEVLDFNVRLIINGLLREENIYFTKPFKDIKKYLKYLKREVVDLYDLEIPNAKEESFCSLRKSQISSVS